MSMTAPTQSSIPKMTSAYHYQTPLSDSDADSDHGNTGSELLRHSDLSDSIFKTYFEFTGQSCTNSIDLSKIQSFLTSSSSGALSCLICLERIRLSDPTWSCTSLCFAVFHLVCIQSWARQASDLAAARAATRLPVTADKAAESSVWNCPKCRVEYSKSQIPKYYTCFCGKLENPPSDDPWVLPHSCGEVCGRALKHNCGHHCLLLCHPGPCPSCPKLVKARCFCGNFEDVRRCGFKNFSCNNVCSKLLDCGIHRCSVICHDDSCPPCRVRGVYRCRCEKKEEERECFDRNFRCDNPCEKVFGCGKHVCSKGCHSGECGQCPLQGKRTCPCGKRFYEGMSCDVPVPLCGATCEKMLSCGLHRCPERCHRGPCIETCRIVAIKFCRCGSLKKEVPCYQDLACERKCQRLRDCGRHACKRRCCDGDCPPCWEICGRKLRCKNHKCPFSLPQRSLCSMSHVMVTISCACGETHFEVPCGTETDQKPPRCPKPCPITPLCRHGSNHKPHKCHYGACPPCRLPCKYEYPCGHTCKLRCHDPRPPPNPEFTLKPKKKKLVQQTGCDPGTPCPSCPELVWRSCIGQHIGAERMMVCSVKSQFSCENLCGNLLPCGNHYCTKTCHALESQSSSIQLKRREPCEDCRLPCQKERTPLCAHPCPRPCHPGECPPCKVLIKRSCHCGSMVHVFECIYYNSLSVEEQVAVRSCGGPCHRKLPNCTHLCPETCHPGQCPCPDKCCKKVTVRCKCHTLKKEWLCQHVQAAYHGAGCDPRDIPKNQFGLGLLPCNSDCMSKAKAANSELQLRKAKVLEEKEPDADKYVPKRRKRRERVQEVTQISKLQKIVSTTKRLLLFVILLATLVGATYFGYKGLLLLSDWMNEVDEQRHRRYPRI
ncbi:NF-X1-type zinc finger protein NFXL2 [Quillaja saponaria]|uniref:NF-X1-type zinc finger protein NFXL2 n=1 Tax=Quillaja saponaria TaxID=32244 RepID=A0AAD7LKJ3_QUISA|nr:NF-X1-type zinc finger protein NFXL2 [Quillaja saponaria]